MNQDYRTVKIPSDLARKIESVIKSSGLGYRNVSEFVIDAARRRLEEIKKMQEVTA